MMAKTQPEISQNWTAISGSDHRLVGRCSNAVIARAASSVISWTPEHRRETVSLATPSWRATSVIEPMESTIALYSVALISSGGCKLPARPCPLPSHEKARCKTHRRNIPRHNGSYQCRRGSRHGERTATHDWRGAKHKTLRSRLQVDWRNRMWSLSCGVVELPKRDSKSHDVQDLSVIFYHGLFPANVRPLAPADNKTPTKQENV